MMLTDSWPSTSDNIASKAKVSAWRSDLPGGKSMLGTPSRMILVNISTCTMCWKDAFGVGGEVGVEVGAIEGARLGTVDGMLLGI